MGGLHELALFSGAGGGILGGMLLGWRTVCAVEIEPYPRATLQQRQDDGILHPFPIWDDITTFDGHPWRGAVDVVTGGFPCQDISPAGGGAGIEGSRSGLWGQMARVIGEVRPRFVFVENSPLLVRRGLAVVLGNFAKMGYDAQWCIISASDAGASHKRDRIWILAHANQFNENDRGSGTSPICGRRPEEAEIRRGEQTSDSTLATTESEPKRPGLRQDEPSRERRRRPGDGDCKNADASGQRPEGVNEAGPTPAAIDRSGYGGYSGWWSVEPAVGRVAYGVANRVDRIKTIGNGQVPGVAVLAWEILTADIPAAEKNPK